MTSSAGRLHGNVGMFILVFHTSERWNVRIVSWDLRNVDDGCSHVNGRGYRRKG